MTVKVIGADRFALELLSIGAGARDTAEKTAALAAEQISQEWQQQIPPSPGGYRGAGFTSSRGANRVNIVSDEKAAGAEAVNMSFVATFLQIGTPTMGPKVDLFGAADSHIDRWVADFASKVAG